MTGRTERVGFGVPQDRASLGGRGRVFERLDQACQAAVKVVAPTVVVVVRIDFGGETPTSPARTRKTQRIQSP